MKTYLTIGGLVAAGFDASGAYLLTVSHSDRGVFSISTWERVARDNTIVYPNDGASIGIGPITGQSVRVAEMDFQKGSMRLTSSDGKVILNCESGGIAVEVNQQI